MANKYLDIMKPNIDQWGVITQTGGESGDGSQRCAMFLVLSYAGWRAGKISDFEYLEIETWYKTVYAKLTKSCIPGDIRRHAGTALWVDGRFRMSRDQWTPNMISLGLLRSSYDKKFLMVFGWSLRGFLFATNLIPNWVAKGDPGYKIKVPDLTIGSSWGFLLRWMPHWLFLTILFVCPPIAIAYYLFLCLCDVDTLVGSFIWKKRIADPTNTNCDILNHTNALVQARFCLPTPISWWARKLIKIDDVNRLLSIYFGDGTPPMDDIAKDALPDIW
jgi:hypothetical protein